MLAPGQVLQVLLLASYATAIWPFSHQSTFVPSTHNESRTADPRTQHAPSTSPPEKKKAMAELLDKYAPIFKLA